MPENSGITEDEGGFNLAKKWLINNEMCSLRSAFGEAYRSLLNDFSKWVPIYISYILGVFTSLVTKQEKITIGTLFGVPIIVILLGFGLDVFIKLRCVKGKKMYNRILEEMTYPEYQVLLQMSDEERKVKGKEEISELSDKCLEFTYRNIQSKLNKKVKSGFKGYQEALAFLRGFTKEQLSYIEVEAKAKLEFSKKICNIDGIITMCLSIVALLFSILPEVTANESVLLERLGFYISILAFVFMFLYMVGEYIMIKPIERQTRIIKIVETIKEKSSVTKS